VGVIARALAPLIGRSVELPSTLAERFPELARIGFRRGGLPARIGGWALGQPWVAAITLWNTVFLAPGTPLDAELLLHELRHVQQFQSSVTFPLRYIWESVRRGYHSNRFEADARVYAAVRLRDAGTHPHRGET
jgi:Domain of unknown function (DUF4157)